MAVSTHGRAPQDTGLYVRALGPRRGDRAAPMRPAVRRVAALALLAFALSLAAGAFAGIVTFVAGLAALAVYAAGHPRASG